MEGRWLMRRVGITDDGGAIVDDGGAIFVLMK